MLVVIGILIALQINNWNEVRKDNDNITRILEGVQVDLVNDMREFSLSAEWSRETNDLIDKVLASEITKNDYAVEEPSSRALLLLGTRRYHVELSNTSFQSLLSYKAKLPTKYSNIIDLLNSMYVEDYAYLNTAQNDLRDFIHRYQYFQYENLPWLISIDINSPRNRDIPAEGLEYFLNDVRHKQNKLIFI